MITTQFLTGIMLSFTSQVLIKKGLKKFILVRDPNTVHVFLRFTDVSTKQLHGLKSYLVHRFIVGRE